MPSFFCCTSFYFSKYYLSGQSFKLFSFDSIIAIYFVVLIYFNDCEGHILYSKIIVARLQQSVLHPWHIFDHLK
jgi:hypothetical protein